MKKIFFIIIGLLIISAVIFSTRIKTNKPTAPTDNTNAVVPAKSLAVPMKRNANNDFVVVDCGRAYQPEAFVKMALPEDWDVIKTEKGAYDEWGSYEFWNKNSQKITVRCGATLDPTCSDSSQNIKVSFQDKDAAFACSLVDKKTVRASVENNNKTGINITFENFTPEEAQTLAGSIYIH